MKWMEAQGFVVHRAIRTGVKRGPFYVSHSNDVWGCMDLCGVKREGKPFFVQVTADSGIGRKSKEILGVPWPLQHVDVAIARWVGGRTGTKHKVTGETLDRQYFQMYDLVEEPGGTRRFVMTHRIHPKQDLEEQLAETFETHGTEEAQEDNGGTSLHGETVPETGDDEAT